MTIRFHCITPAAQSYPKPYLPVQPVLSFSTLALAVNNVPQSSAFGGQGAFFGNARTCLAHAFALSGAGADSAVLIPAYHCGSMVEPALWLNTEVLLYHLEPNLSPIQQHLEKLIANATKPIRAMLLPHYFGFPQDVDHWRAFCDTHNMKLIEDCAHAFFGTSAEGRPLGTIGDYAVASVRKFFGSPDGGILIGENILPATLSTTQPSVFHEFHAIMQAAMLSAESGRLGIIGKLILQLDDWRSMLKRNSLPTLAPSPIKEPKTRKWNWFDPALMGVRGLAVSQALMKHSRVQYIGEVRRRNYSRLVEGIVKIQGVEPLFSELPDHVVPYMVPVLLESGESNFDRIKRAGIPVWRWEELAESDCAVSQRYRLQLLQIPCHQDLTSNEIDWIINQLSEILGTRKP